MILLSDWVAFLVAASSLCYALRVEGAKPIARVVEAASKQEDDKRLGGKTAELRPWRVKGLAGPLC